MVDLDDLVSNRRADMALSMRSSANAQADLAEANNVRIELLAGIGLRGHATLQYKRVRVALNFKCGLLQCGGRGMVAVVCFPPRRRRSSRLDGWMTMARRSSTRRFLAINPQGARCRQLVCGRERRSADPVATGDPGVSPVGGGDAPDEAGPRSGGSMCCRSMMPRGGGPRHRRIAYRSLTSGDRGAADSHIR